MDIDERSRNVVDRRLKHKNFKAQLETPVVRNMVVWYVETSSRVRLG